MFCNGGKEVCSDQMYEPVANHCNSIQDKLYEEPPVITSCENVYYELEASQPPVMQSHTAMDSVYSTVNAGLMGAELEVSMIMI